MNVLIAFDSWSGFLSSVEASTVAAEVLRARGHLVRTCPLADGGDGTGAALERAGLASPSIAHTLGPTGAPVAATLWALAGGGVLVESAQAVGRPLCPDPPDPLGASSHGLGDLLAAAPRAGDGPILVGLGGSGTMDGGLGLAQALGLTALDDAGAPLPPRSGAGALERVAALEGSLPALGRLVQAWCDVDATLAESATRFGPQKGAGPAEIAAVGRGLERWVDALNRWRATQGRRPIDPDTPGAGAAGGLGFGLAALLGASLRPGAPRVADAVGLDARLQNADVVLTGEGRLDPTSFTGKVVSEVTRRARAAGIRRVIALAGEVRGPLPPPPAGPDLALPCAPGPAEGRLARYREALEGVADRLESG